MLTDLVRSRPGGFDIRPASHDAATQVAEFVWMSPGLSNSYLVVTGEGRVIVNTGMGFEAPVHKAAFDKVDTSPVRYIVFTQGHVDHVGGADHLAGAGTEIVAQANNPACQADDARIHVFRVQRSVIFWKEAVQKAHAYITANLDGPIPPQSTPTPTITFDDTASFELGGVRFELIATPGGETIDSACLWLPGERIAFVGNLFSALFGHVPNLVTLRGDKYRFVPAFLESLDRVKALEPEVLLTGHFDPIRGRDLIQAELQRIRDAVDWLHERTLDGMNGGADVYTLMREIEFPEHLEIGQGYGKVSWVVRAIWESYAGWFHHRSTTELYGVPASAVSVDVVALAGADAIVERAMGHIRAGKVVEALHLAEIVLEVDPTHHGALEASLGAHELLLEESAGVNFWEVGWLRHRIGELQAAIETGAGA